MVTSVAAQQSAGKTRIDVIAHENLAASSGRQVDASVRSFSSSIVEVLKVLVEGKPRPAGQK